MNKVKTICLRISEIELKMLKEDAEKHEMSVSEYLRYLVRKENLMH